MNKRLLTLTVLGLTTATTACAITPAMQKKYERSGCTQMSELNGCDVNKSYQWNRDHGFIENSNGQQNRHHHGENSKIPLTRITTIMPVLMANSAEIT